MTTVADRLAVQTALLTEIRDLLAGQVRTTTSIHESGLREDVESSAEALRSVAAVQDGGEVLWYGPVKARHERGAGRQPDDSLSSAEPDARLASGGGVGEVAEEAPEPRVVVEVVVRGVPCADADADAAHEPSPSSVADTPEARPAPAPASADPVAELEGDLRAAQLHDLGQAGTARYLVFQGWRRA